MNELALYEDMCDELRKALGDIVEESAVDKLCEEWVSYLKETRAENSRMPMLVSLSDDVQLPEGLEGAPYALVEDVADDWGAYGDSSREQPNATGLLDQPRLLRGRLFQVQDVPAAVFNAVLKAKVKEMAKGLGGNTSTDPDLKVQLTALVIESAPELVGEVKAFVSKKKVDGPEERAVVLTAFSMYESDLHDSKNEPFTASAMLAWLEEAKTGSPELPLRARDSVRAVDEGQWSPTKEGVDQLLSALMSKGFFRSAGKSGSDQLYCINI